MDKFTPDFIEKQYQRCKEHPNIGFSTQEYFDALMEITRLQSAARWVPVSERLPETTENASNPMLVTVKCGTATIFTYNMMISYWPKYGWVHNFVEGRPYTMADFGYEVISWMEQPQPDPEPPQG